MVRDGLGGEGACAYCGCLTALLHFTPRRCFYQVKPLLVMCAGTRELLSATSLIRGVAALLARLGGEYGRSVTLFCPHVKHLQSLELLWVKFFCVLDVVRF